jgi:protease-4
MDASEIVDRRQMRRRVSFWRAVAFIVLLVALLALINGSTEGGLLRQETPQIARISISGFIANDRAEVELIEHLAEDDSIKAVIVTIDSSGGTTAGGEALYEALRKLAEAKPTVATMDTIGASAAYMAAIAADHIVARRTTLTGSIGVLFQFPEFGDLLDKLGVDVAEVTSGPLKAEPSLFEPASPEGLAMIQTLVNDTYQWFVAIVAERRGMTVAEATALADGRIFTGGQALEAGLVDALGGEDAAIAWLAEQGVDEDLPVRSWAPSRAGIGFPFAAAAARLVAALLGLPPEGVTLLGAERILPERLMLDGLLSVWQAPSSRPEVEGAPR